MKLCKLCKLPFEPKFNAQTICRRNHYNKCPICNKVIIWNSERAPKPCSKQCSSLSRRQTNISRYGLANVRNLRKQSNTNSYNNFKYIQSCDKNLSLLMSKYGIDIWNESMNKDECNNIKSISCKEFTIYIDSNGFTNKFLAEFGLVTNAKLRKQGVTLNLVKDDLIYQSIRFQLAKLKGFSYELSNIAIRPQFRIDGGLTMLFNKAIELYQLDSIVAIIDNNKVIENELLNSGFEKQFERPVQVKWSSGSAYKKTDNIQRKLNSGDQLVKIGHIRSVYTYSSK